MSIRTTSCLQHRHNHRHHHVSFVKREMNSNCLCKEAIMATETAHRRPRSVRAPSNTREPHSIIRMVWSRLRGPPKPMLIYNNLNHTTQKNRATTSNSNTCKLRGCLTTPSIASFVQGQEWQNISKSQACSVRLTQTTLHADLCPVTSMP